MKGPGGQNSTQIDKKLSNRLKIYEKFEVGDPKRLRIDFGGQKWTQEDDFGGQEADFGGQNGGGSFWMTILELEQRNAQDPQRS